LEEAIKTVHLNITPTGAYSLGALTALIALLGGAVIMILTWLINSATTVLDSEGLVVTPGIIEPQWGLGVFIILSGVILMKPLAKYPIHLASKWRLAASNQMVLCILYVVIYMRHTSNLEHGIKFAGEHVGNPLALDLRKVVWDVETQRFATIKQSLDHYLEYWRKYNLEFVESFNLIQSSILEGDNKKRIGVLEKALEVMLEGTYENMLHFAQDVKAPITTLYMLGVILPILGLIVLPLLGGFMGVKWYQVGLFYNLTLPIVVYFMGYRTMSKRPMGYGSSDIYEKNPRYWKYRMLVYNEGTPQEKVVDPKNTAWFIGVFIVLIAFSPLVYHWVMPDATDPELPLVGPLLDYKETEDADGNDVTVGPFGVGAALFSLLIPLGIAFGVGFYYKVRTQKLMGIREETKKLEKEFQGALFQMGNRISGGIPSEMAFGDVASNLKGTPTGNFLSLVDKNIRKRGMNINQAIFNSKVGAILDYPSSLIESSMKVLVSSSQKGPAVVSNALISIATYLDRINKVNERLKDLLAEIVGSIKAQIAFLSPMIAGIVVGIGSMITGIIAGLGKAMEEQTASGGDAAGMMGGAGGLMDMFPVYKMMPTFFFQLVVGLYVLEIVFILSILANGIENGVDKLNEEYMIGKNLNKSMILYSMVAGLGMLAFQMLAKKIVEKQGA
jgi:hypothetical protein